MFFSTFLCFLGKNLKKLNFPGFFNDSPWIRFEQGPLILLAQFQKRAVKNLKKYSTKNDKNLRKPKAGH